MLVGFWWVFRGSLVGLWWAFGGSLWWVFGGCLVGDQRLLDFATSAFATEVLAMEWGLRCLTSFLQDKLTLKF